MLERVDSILKELPLRFARLYSEVGRPSIAPECSYCLTPPCSAVALSDQKRTVFNKLLEF